jgi:hypothetical protein
MNTAATCNVSNKLATHRAGRDHPVGAVAVVFATSSLTRELSFASPLTPEFDPAFDGEFGPALEPAFNPELVVVVDPVWVRPFADEEAEADVEP